MKGSYNLSHRYVIVCLAMTMFLSSFLLSYNLDSKSLWSDECTDINLSAKSLKDIIEWTDNTPHPSLYYLIRYVWIEIFGKDEVINRIFSIVFASLSILPLYMIAKLLWNKNLGLISAFIYSFSPLFILRGSMIKWYSIATFFGLLSIWAFLMAIRKDKKWIWTIYIISSTIIIYVHYLPFSILLGQNIYILALKNRFKSLFKKWYLSQLIIFVFYLPQVSKLIKHLALAPNYGPPAILAHTLIGNLVKISYPLYAFCFGETILPWNFLITIPSSMIFIYLFIKGSKQFFYKKEDAYFYLSLFCMPFAFLILITYIIFPSESFHNFPGLLIYVLPIFLLIISVGIYSLKKKRNQIMIIVVIILVSGYSLKNYYRKTEYINPNYMIPWKQISRDLKSEVSEDDFVIATDESLYYYRGSLPMLLMDETRKTTEIKKYIKKTLPRNIWLQVRDWGDFAGALWVREFRDWLSNNCVLSTGERGYVEEDKATIFFKEKLLKRPVPKYKVMIYKYTKK